MGADPFAGLPSIFLDTEFEAPLLGSVDIQSPAGLTMARFRRSGTGLRTVRMNFVLEDLAGRPLYYVRTPASPRLGCRISFEVLDSGEAPVGQITQVGWWGSEARLVRDGAVLLAAKLSGWRLRRYSVLAGGVPVARVTSRRPVIPTPKNPWGDLVEFGPVGPAVPRGLLTTFVAFLGLVHRRGPGV